MVQRIRVPDSSSGVSDQQSMGSSSSCGTCVLEQDTLPQLLCPTDETLSRSRSCVLGFVLHFKKTQITYRGRVAVNSSVSSLNSKHPCLQVLLWPAHTVIKFTYEALLVSFSETCNNRNILHILFKN